VAEGLPKSLDQQLRCRLDQARDGPTCRWGTGLE
jgi:hypothetical protein